ncbi:hypothetical protein XAC71A_790007 [Xanthomonas citri pv. citri]|nr:hypothetical protein XAC71A_790007 [Xanthomonas citri pv. citri]
MAATMTWVAAAALHEGPLFRAVNQWGGIAAAPLHPNSLVHLLRRIFREAGLSSPTTTAATRCGAALPAGPTPTAGMSRR